PLSPLTPSPSTPAAALTTAAAAAIATAIAATAAPTYCAPMASLRVLAFDHEGRQLQFDTWLDDLQLYLLSDSKVSVSLFDLASGAATAPPAIADSATRSQWLTRDAAARLAIRNHLPLTECAHFGQHRTAHALLLLLACHYCSRPTATAQLVPRAVSICHNRGPVALGAARGTPCPPLFEGCSPSPLAPSYAFAAAADVFIAEDVGAASAGAKRRSSKGKGGKGGGGGSGGGGGGSGRSGGGSSGGGGGGGTGGGSGGSGGGGGGNSGSGGSGGSGTGGGGTGAQRVGFGGGQHQQQQRWSETQSPQQLHLLMSKIAIFDLDFDVILSAMYALSVSAEGECYRCVPPDLGIAAVALGASESGTLPVTAPSQALHTFMLDSGASACFFRDTPLSLLSLHLSWSDWLTPLRARSWPVHPLSSRVRRFRLAHCQVFTSPCSLRAW
ncbi:unnamed protein product, partial [Closterium sp. NIES-54]